MRVILRQTFLFNDVKLKVTHKVGGYTKTDELFSSTKYNNGYEHTPEERYKEYTYQPFLWEFIKHRVFIRLLEINGNTPLSAKRICEILTVSKNEEQSISGMRGILLQAGVVAKENDGIIYKGTLPKIKDYQRIVPLSNHAILRCKKTIK